MGFESGLIEIRYYLSQRCCWHCCDFFLCSFVRRFIKD